MSGGKKEITGQVEAIVRDLLSGRRDGLFLDRVEFERQGSRWCLRVVLDHAETVTIDHCAEVSEELGRRLDAGDPIGHSYTLEVSSPGVERRLVKDADFERFKGRQATLHFYRAWNGSKRVTGRLEGLNERGEILLDLRPKGVTGFPRDEVSSAHLAVDWSGSGRDGTNGGGQG